MDPNNQNPIQNSTQPTPPQEPAPPAQPSMPDQSSSPAPDQAATPPPPTPQNNTPSNTNSAVVTGGGKKGGGRKKLILGVLALIFILAGSAGAFYLLRPMLTGTGEQANCQNYNFSIAQNGEVTVTNNTEEPSSAQTATVFIGENEEAQLDVPIVNPGETITIGAISTPEESFNWTVTGGNYCEDTGSHELLAEAEAQIECGIIRAYDENWSLLASNELGELEAGDIVRFTVAGSADSGEFDMARFTINDEVLEETTDVKPETNEFYQEYEIPEATSQFVVNAKVHHVETDQWY